MLSAALVRPPTTSRRISAGIRPVPGATAAAPAWWSADDWLVEVRLAVVSERDVCRTHHVEADTVVAVARAMATYADFDTGRECRPTNARLVEDLRVSLSTVQRARRALKALGLVIELIAGRSEMTREERLSAWRRGSSHRRIAATFALCSRRRRPQLRLVPVERDTPPGAPTDHLSSQDQITHLRAKAETTKAAPRPAHTKKVVPIGRRRPDPATRRLIEGTRARLRWLSGVSARRLAPPLHRFAQAGWTPRDVERAVGDALASRGWRLPREIAQPAAYLATLLRVLDPEDRPGALDDAMAAAERAQRAYERQLVTGTPCPHGQPAGHIPSPLRGHLACPLCRAEVPGGADERGVLSTLLKRLRSGPTGASDDPAMRLGAAGGTGPRTH